MNIAVLSGKGGTGKTLLSVNLSYIAKNAAYVDCDVEEPNGLLYYQLKTIHKDNVYTKMPVIDHNQCIGCRKCTDFCKFNALAFIKGKVKVYEDLCHACGGCSIICPVNAISEVDKIIGTVTSGVYEGTDIYSGELVVGEETGVPIIKSLLHKARNENKHTFIDSPPGNGCSVMESITDADYCLLVAEPSIFGLHNLNMVYNLAKVFHKKVGLVINKATDNRIINDYAREKKIKIVGEIPMDFHLGKLNSEGQIVAKEKAYEPIFKDILNNIYKEVQA